ncbi:MAG TPA: DUF1616 domain-containing protein [Solirubrobacterales bacterium]|jgi:uncharacterized membrane protein|nr:DUF1616 domain-containing protein [Solirubrobacterales bacterium]
MRSRGVPRSADLRATIAATLIGSAVALFVDSGPFATATLLPLVLILPGYALSAMLFPPGAIGRDRRLVLTVSLSIGATALSALILQLAVSLDRAAFVVLLALVTLSAAAAALNRRGGESTDRSARLSLGRVPIASAVAFAAAIALSGLAIAIASAGATRQLDESHFSALWLLPQGGPRTPPDNPPVRVGISNHEGKSIEYRLRVSQGTTNVGLWRVRLDEGDEWQTILPASVLLSHKAVVASLSRYGMPYRRAILELGTGSNGAPNG